MSIPTAVCGLQSQAPFRRRLLFCPQTLLLLSLHLHFPPSGPILIPNQANEGLSQGSAGPRTLPQPPWFMLLSLSLYILAFTPVWHISMLPSTNVLMLPVCLSSSFNQRVYFIRKQALVCISEIHILCYLHNGHIILLNEL